jgi:chromosomal replication initiator protein
MQPSLVAWMPKKANNGVPGVMNTENTALWSRIQARLKFNCGVAVYRSWLQHLELVSTEGNMVQLHVPTRFIREWVISHYVNEILAACKQELPHLVHLDVRVRPAATNVAILPQEEKIVLPKVMAAKPEAEDFAIGATLDPRYRFSSFVTDKSNELAFAAAQRVAESPEVIPGCNPLFLYGGVGLGKTHLMHAIGWHIRENNPKRKVLYLSAEKFMYQFISALRQRDIMSFKDQFRGVDVLMIDDVQFISGKDSTQEEFFHTFNALIDQNKQLVISCDRSPSDLEEMEERVRSRLGWGLVADINATTYELRLGVLQMKCEQLKVAVPKDVLEFLARKIPSNIRELEGVINLVSCQAQLKKRDVTINDVRQLIATAARPKKSLSTEELIKIVADFYGVEVSAITDKSRKKEVVKPRQITMYVLREFFDISYPTIGDKLGGRDHTTIIHSYEKVKNDLKSDPALGAELEQIRSMF